MRFRKTGSMLLIVVITFSLGCLTGIVLDKEWFTVQEQNYIKKLHVENKELSAEKEAWLSYLKEEIGEYHFYLAPDAEEFQYLGSLLAQIGAEVKVLEDIGILESDGLLISLGQELDISTEVPQLTLEALPMAATDVQNFYLSILRMKGAIEDVGSN